MIIVSLVIIFIYVILKSNKSMHMLQQNWYNDDNRYLKWIANNRIKNFITPDMFFVFFFIFSLFSPVWISTLIFIFYFVQLILFLKLKKTEQVKKPLVFTKRIKRLILTTITIYFLIGITSYLVSNLVIDGRLGLIYFYLTIGFSVYFNLFIIYLANIINKPIEKFVYRYYYKKASNKLEDLKYLKVIGITGSYGKTSSKNILYDVLSSKYNVFKTPKNYNTTYGMMLSINNHLDKFNDYFIAEMGAFNNGEIKELCDFVKPKYGILTKIGPAHLDTYGSIENIQKTKFELIESLPIDGVAILNKDDEYQTSYSIKNKVNVKWISLIDKNSDVYADNIKLDKNGMTFECHFKGDKKAYKMTTCLLGKANIYNILAAVALADYLNINKEQIIMGVRQIKPIEHRLEMKKIGDVTIIDDAYNSNPIGSKMAVEVLGMMPGKRIIVTPGMIELGQEEYELNMKFGTYIASNCDEVILVGEKQTKPIYEGLMLKKFNKKKIHIINDVKEAFVLINKLKGKETYALLENDLPDIFNE